ncbi:thiamine-phosphate kinase [Oxalobacteraceae bacterium A2-2]
MLSEFDLIKEYFVRARPARASLGIGDDCALLTPTPGMQTAISSDMLVEGRHFFAGADARKLGHKALAVNLSDLAAMGARPVGFTLALALPAAERAWLEGFAAGLFALADVFDIELIGGDTTKGPLNICITVFGEVAPGRALRRDAARPGDDIWVSGSLGDARLALAGLRGELALDDSALAASAVRLHTPVPRVELGLLLSGQGLAHAAIDISDGLVGDLGHILERSGVGATLDLDALPAGDVLATRDQDLRRRYAAAGGDDYELCFTAPASARAAIVAAAASVATPVARVGAIEAASGLRLTDAGGRPLDLRLDSYDHFTS